MRRFVNDMILEGGSIDVNGEGLLLTSEQCPVEQEPQSAAHARGDRAEPEGLLGVAAILWVGDGIVRDDTDGHIDDITRSTDPTASSPACSGTGATPTTGSCARTASGSARSARRRTPLRRGRAADARTVRLRRTGRCRELRQLPRHHGAVLVPQFARRSATPRRARSSAICFRGREIVGVDCHDLIWGLGTLHCISQQQPA